MGPNDNNIVVGKTCDFQNKIEVLLTWTQQNQRKSGWDGLTRKRCWTTILANIL